MQCKSHSASAHHAPLHHLTASFDCICCDFRDKTADESELESEVEQLRKKLEGMKELTPGETDTIGDLEQELDEKEKALYKMQVRQTTGCAAGQWQLLGHPT